MPGWSLRFASLMALLTLASATARSHEQGPTSGQLTGTGDFGNIELVGVFAQSNPVDVAVNASRTHAFVSTSGNADCTSSGVSIVDITDLANPQAAGFIAAPKETQPAGNIQVVSITTPFFSGEMLLVSTAQCGKYRKGGVVMWDVTDPLNPRKLSEHIGTRARNDSNDANGVFAWDAGDSAFAAVVDNADIPMLEILDISNPWRATVAVEYDLTPSLANLTQPLVGLRDLRVKNVVMKVINGHRVLLLSAFDGGFVQVEIDNAFEPTLIGDTDYQISDPELLESTGANLPPEGNAHHAEFTADNTWFIGTDQDFEPYGATTFAITTGTNAGTYPATYVTGATLIVTLPDQKLNGPTIYGGYGCADSTPIPPASNLPPLLPGEEAIVVLQRGPTDDPGAPEPACLPGEKAHQALEAGYDAVVFVESHLSSTAFCGSGGFTDSVVGVCTSHEAFHKIFNTTVSFTYPDGPAVGTLGAKIEANSLFDGWGYVHLYRNVTNSGKFEEVDTYAIAESHNEAFAVGFGSLSAHEVATHPTVANKAYVAYYAGGLRSLQIQSNELVEVGGYLGPAGNNIWGVEAFERGGQTFVLATDRKGSLLILRDTAP